MKLLAIAVILTAIGACKEEKGSLVITNQYVAGCHTNTDKLAAKDMNTDSVVVTWIDESGPLQVTHYNMMLDCGGANITTTVEQSDNVVTVVEHVGEQGITNCICLYDNSFQIENLPPRPFTLVIKMESLYCGSASQSTVYQETFE